MKTKLLGFVFIGMIVKSYSCDLHNGINTSNPFLNNNFVSFSYKHSIFSGVHYHFENSNDEHGHSHIASKPLTEYYGTLDLSLSYYVLKDFQLTIKVPYAVNNEYLDNNKTESTYGLSDISASLRYRKKKKMNNATIFAFFGGGAVLPTGKYNTANSKGGINPLSQVGRGAFRFLGSTTIGYIKDYFGVFADINQTVYSQNNIGYSFANRTNVNLNSYYQIKKNNYKISPNIGQYLEYSKQDKWYEKTMSNTGGFVSFTTLGADFYFKKVFLSITYQIPVLQKLNGIQGKNLNRLITSINFNF